jgi:hypothetical protein
LTKTDPDHLAKLRKRYWADPAVREAKIQYQRYYNTKNYTKIAEARKKNAGKREEARQAKKTGRGYFYVASINGRHTPGSTDSPHHRLNAYCARHGDTNAFFAIVEEYPSPAEAMMREREVLGLYAWQSVPGRGHQLTEFLEPGTPIWGLWGLTEAEFSESPPDRSPRDTWSGRVVRTVSPPIIRGSVWPQSKGPLEGQMSFRRTAWMLDDDE